MEATSDDRLFSMLIYVISLFFPVLGPLIIWLIKRDDSDFIDYHGKEYFNFLISFTIYGIIAGLLIFVLIGLLLAPIVGIVAFILTIIAAVKAYQGDMYRFPFIFRLIK
ncbi:DUF4870 domain-containing protein [Aliibacillus thermotolerans]|uniref:DUF4870 domain-containing protein n=1 Tax=Aliibacillus thermotolerans TaxID=1834418 RepID=A0ABW0U6I7_9BACI|nr:DUF4870 domain-containing protein [Aliibacillus thermotolerans]MDA3130421.1 DUF4870 domain-containing protein [Aliibacillus thermotolerans]